MMRFKYVKVKDVTGETFEYENCEVARYFNELHITYPVPLGTIKKVFNMKNIIFVDYLPYEKGAPANG